MNPEMSYKNQVAQCESAVPVRQTVASEILELAEEIERMAEDVANRTLSRLQPVMRDDMNEKGLVEGDKPFRIYPELFDVIRGRLTRIKGHLLAIDGGIDRLEL